MPLSCASCLVSGSGKYEGLHIAARCSATPARCLVVSLPSSVSRPSLPRDTGTLLWALLSSMQTARRSAHGSQMPRESLSAARRPRVAPCRPLPRAALPHRLYSAPLGIERCSWPRTMAHNLLAAIDSRWINRAFLKKFRIVNLVLTSTTPKPTSLFVFFWFYTNLRKLQRQSINLKRKNCQCLVNKLKSNT